MSKIGAEPLDALPALPAEARIWSSNGEPKLSDPVDYRSGQSPMEGFSLERALVKERRRAADAEAALDCLAVATFIVTASGRLLHMNRAAAALIRRHCGLAIRRGHLATRAVSQQTALDRLMAQAGVASAAADKHSEGAMAVHSGFKGRALPVRVLPLREANGTNASPGHVLVLANDPNLAASYPDALLREVYALTTSEAEIANYLVAGRCVKEIAKARAVTVGTTQVQLKRMLAKTQTRGQAELVRLLLLPPQAAGDSR